MKNVFLLSLILGISLSACTNKNDSTQMQQPAISKSNFGQLPDGRGADLYTLTNSNGMEVKITNFGGIVTSITVPNKNGQFENVVLGFDSLNPYLAEHPYFGALVGRYGNRIANGKFTLDGTTYSLAINNGPNALHGGQSGFDKALWDAAEILTDTTAGLKLKYTSNDMEEGYPGQMKTEVTYTLTNENALRIDYKATTDKTTIINLTNHSYFNLTGLKRDILAHEVYINADSLVAVNANLIPKGKLEAVAGTAFDFRKASPIGSRIDDPNSEQIRNGGGYDHCWALNSSKSTLPLIASVYDPESGRTMEVFTTEPGVQFYTGNFLDGSLSGKGVTYTKRFGFCLETQHFPDSPNQPQFPSTVLQPGKTYQTTTQYKFGVKKD